MKNFTLRSVVASIFALMLPVCVMADDESVTTFTYEGIVYRVVESPVEVWDFGKCYVYQSETKYSGDMYIAKMAVDENYNYYYITGVDANAFKDCTELTSIKLANKIETIGSQAFSGCTSLRAVDMSLFASAEKIPTLAEDAFDESTYSSAVLMTGNAEMLEAFKAADVWKNFSNVILNSFEYDKVKYEINSDFTTVTATFIDMDDYGKSATTGDIVIPETVENNGATYTVTAIGNYGFSEMYELGVTSINIPATVTSIGTAAFAGGYESGTTLKTITVNWTTPLAVEETDKLFLNIGTKDDDGNYDRSSITLNVPAGTVDAYKAAEVWKTFNIVESTTVGISEVNRTSDNPTVIYDLSGKRINTLQKGINIIRVNGKTMKVMH